MIKRVYLFLPAKATGLLLSVMLLLLSGSSLASTSDKPCNGVCSLYLLSPDSPIHDLASAIAYYEDKPAKLTLNDVIELDKALAFTKSEGNAPSFTSTDSAYWFHVKLLNSTDTPITWYAQINYPLLDDISFNIVRKTGVSSIDTGDSKPFDSRPVNHQYFVFPILFEPNEELDIYVRVVSSGAITLPLRLYQAEELLSTSNTHSLLQGLHYGTLLILSIYNCLLFGSTRSASYLYNALYMLSLGLFMFSISGLSFQYIWPDNPGIANTSIPVTEGFVILTIALFARSFLLTSEEQHNTLRAINVITAFGVVIILLGLTTPYHIAVKVGTLLGVIAIVIVYLIGVTRLSENYKPAKQFVLAWTIFLAAALTYALATFGFIPNQFIQEYIIRIATGAQVIFINIALATRVRVLNQQLIDSETKAKETLESQVAQRTQQLEKAMTTLSNLNETLQSISTTDELTGIANRRFFNDTLDENIKLANREQQSLSLLLIDIDHFKLVNDAYGHLVGDKCLIHLTTVINHCLHRPGDFLARYGGEEFAAVLPNTSSSGAELIARHILDSVRQSHFTASGLELSLTVSIGITTHDAPISDKSILIREADQALYLAKNSGRNNCKRYQQQVTIT